MAYIINRYNGTVLTTVEDGTINQSTEVKFIGKNYAGYGEAQNENFMFLLENFSSSTAPTKPISGMLWHDSNNNKIKFYDGAKWKATGGADVSASEPTGSTEGDIYWNTSTQQLFARNASNQWVLVGPQGAGTGVTQMRSLTLTESGTSTTHAVIAATIEDEVLFIISPASFTIATADAISGFGNLNAGITLKNTNTSGVTTSGHRFYGTASDSDRLGGLLASAYVLDTGTSPTTFDGALNVNNDGGVTYGAGGDLVIKIESDGVTPGAYLNTDTLNFRDSSETLLYTMTNTGFIPGADATYNLGNPSNSWNIVYAETFSGIATQANQLRLGGSGSTYVNSSTAGDANTIAARDASGNLSAVLFSGTATKARYADLAEKYTTAEELPAGTAVAVCSHEDHEVEPASASSFCIGVVSTDPAVMMNSEADGQYIGLKGRLPVRVKGPVKKGQAVYAMADGVSTTIATSALVGVALESNDSEDEKLVECVLKV